MFLLLAAITAFRGPQGHSSLAIIVRTSPLSSAEKGLATLISGEKAPNPH